MLLELLFASPREGADFRAPGGDVPQEDAERFDALLANEASQKPGRAPVRGRSEAGTPSADAKFQDFGSGAPFAGGDEQSPYTSADTMTSQDSAPSPVVAADDTEAPELDAAPMPESREPDKSEAFAASAPAPAPTPAPENTPDTGGNAVKASAGADPSATPTPPPAPTDMPAADAEGIDEMVARSDAAAKVMPVRTEASFNAAMAQVRAGTQTAADATTQPRPQPAPAAAPAPAATPATAAAPTSEASRPMPVAVDADNAAEPTREAALLARKELLAARGASGDGSETRLAAFARREMGAGRLDTGERAGFADAAKPGDNAKLDLSVIGRQTPAQPQPGVPAVNLQVPQPAMNPAQFAQSGLAALLASQTGQGQHGFDTLTQTAGSDTGEIRLEVSGQTLARTESAAAQAARAGTPLNMRLAAGQMPAIAQLIAKRFGEGGRSFDIRLDPAELGRVHVRLEIGADRTVQAMLTAEKPEALQELQRHARELERALADAGLELGESGIGFALFDGSQDQDRPAGGSPSSAGDHDDEAARLTLEPQRSDAAIERFGFTLAARGGVDVRI